MDRTLPSRRHVPHWEIPGGIVCMTWRLHRLQALLQPEERGVVLEVLRRCEPEAGVLFAAVVMDDHVHALVKPARGYTARRLAAIWRNTSAHRLCGEGRRPTPLWQAEYFDRWMKGVEQTDACAQYIAANPRRRWPELATYSWVLIQHFE